ncbi:MAG: Hypothetical protein BHV28_01990 [Candidatus Tokpelaia hoelldobleri]|uniref:Uncharacterized protein n=1 Tax=Candidatus Tokpelaia hoelldobleri TaxID=1902579 RepID=A0A1U9JST5_9HYPH|nr:MAG: Hypothetical protein BHV28_01990 [Candidatus Tokpelaia hoelldoblerii]
MVRYILVGVWVCLVTAGALAFGAYSQDKSPAQAVEIPPTLTQERTNLMSVPVIVNGNVAGYIITQLLYTVDIDARKQLSLPLGAFINDEVFRIFYGAYSDTRSVEMVQFDEVRQKIIDAVNQRFPQPVLKDLLVDQFNYVSTEKVRERSGFLR